MFETYYRSQISVTSSKFSVRQEQSTTHRVKRDNTFSGFEVHSSATIIQSGRISTQISCYHKVMKSGNLIWHNLMNLINQWVRQLLLHVKILSPVVTGICDLCYNYSLYNQRSEIIKNNTQFSVA